MRTENELEVIRAYYPFMFSEHFDPRSIFSVGEQVQSEYLFATHARTTLSTGFDFVMSKVSFDSVNHVVTISPKYDVVDASGTHVPMRALCDGVRSSLQGTRHAPYASILQNIECDEERREIKIQFSRIPLNLRFLFTIPDFSIFRPESLPMSLQNFGSGTGPYYLDAVSTERIALKVNPHYPKELRANSADAEIHRYVPSDTKSFVANMNREIHHSAYFYGHALDADDRKVLEDKGYKVETFPTEWFVYLIAKKNVPRELREALQAMILNFQKNKRDKLNLGMPAFSVSPADREFSLTEGEYIAATGFKDSNSEFVGDFVVYTLESWSKIPVYANLIAEIRERFPQARIELLGKGGGQRMFADPEVQVAISLLGISPSDPLTHFSFLETTLDGYSELVSKEEIAQISTLDDSAEFNQRVKDAELRTAAKGLIIPVAHYPGIVAYRDDLKRDDNYAYGWGIQTWSFRKDSQQ